MYVNRNELQRASLVGIKIGDTNKVKDWLFKFLFLFPGLCKIPFGVFFFESRFASSRFPELKQGFSNLRRLVA